MVHAEYLRGKKLLLVGGIGPTADLIELAHRNGVRIGVADYNKDTRIKQMADFQHEVNAVDVDALTELYLHEGYNGIISNFNDMLSPYVARVAERVGAFVPYDVELLRMSTDKKYFKKTCIDYGVQVPREYYINDISQIEKSTIDFPVIVKPVDGSGSKGISICRNRMELSAGYTKALEMSRSGNVIIEDYLPFDEINITYIAQDGDIQLAAIHDRYFNENQQDVMKVPDMYIYPSKYTGLVYEKYNDQILNMLRGIGVKNGSMFIQAIVKEDQVYLYEAGMRLNGCKTYQILEVENDYNTFEHLMQYALTGSMGDYCHFDARLSRWYATWNVVGVPGMTCQSFSGIEELNTYPWLIRNAQTYGSGETIPLTAKGTLVQLVSRIHVYGNTKEQLLEHIDCLQKTFKVKDPDGKDVLMKPHDINDLREKLNYDLF